MEKISLQFTLSRYVWLMNWMIKEKEYIQIYNSIYPNGYNLTHGGKGSQHIKISNNMPLNKPCKRGRDFGYVHSDNTKKVMSYRLKAISLKQNRDKQFSSVLIDFYKKKKIKILSEYPNLEKYMYTIINGVVSKKTKIIHDYNIIIEGKKLTLHSNRSLDEKFQLLKDYIDEAIILQKSKNC